LGPAQAQPPALGALLAVVGAGGMVGINLLYKLMRVLLISLLIAFLSLQKDHELLQAAA
jgi:hypothetical protein